MKKINKILDIESPIEIFIFSLLNVAIAFLFLHLYNNSEIPRPLFIAIGSAYLIIFVLWLFLSFKPQKSYYSKGLTNFDILLLILSISYGILAVLSYPQFKIFSDGELLPCTLFLGLFLGSFICFGWRMHYIKKTDDIKNLCLYDVLQKKNLPIDYKNLFIENTESEVDLLFRNQIVDHIRSAIVDYKGSGKQIIAIRGKWGSGKTTLLNLALKGIKEEDNIIICNKFDPWSYSDIRSMLVGILNAIYESLDIGHSNLKIKGQIERFANAFTIDEHITLISRLLTLNPDLMSLNHLIDDYLLSNRKRLVVIIDNLDRITSDKFYFVYQLIAKLVDIKMVSFVCLYDEDLAKQHLNEYHIDSKFLEKLTSIKIDVPNPSTRNITKIGIEAVTNIVEKYFPKQSIESSNQLDYLTIIFGSCADLRDLINLLNNYLHYLTPLKVPKVNLIDYLGITFIRYFNYELFEKIYENAGLFIKSDASLSSHSDVLMNTDDKMRRIKDFEKKYLSGNNEKFAKILDVLFPYYNDVFTTIDSTTIKKYDVESRICSGKHFDSYFKNEETSFTEINFEIRTLLKKKKITEKTLDNLFKKYNKDDHAFVIEILDKMTDEKNDFANVFLDYFIKHYADFSDRVSFFLLSARARCSYFVAKMLMRINHDDALARINEMTIKQIVLLSQIKIALAKLLKNENTGSNLIQDLDSRINYLFKLIIENKINVYSREHYCRRITFVLLSCGRESTKEYLKEIIDENHIFPFLVDCFNISQTLSGVVTISFEKKSVENFFDLDVIKELLSKASLLQQKDKDIYQIAMLGINSITENSFDIEGLDYQEAPNWVYDYYTD